jgi:hypothetical protein
VPEYEVGTSEKSSQSTALYGNTFRLGHVEKVLCLSEAAAVFKKKHGVKFSLKATELTYSLYRLGIEEARKEGISHSPWKLRNRRTDVMNHSMFQKNLCSVKCANTLKARI